VSDPLHELVERPEVDQPVLVVGLDGWIDAGFAANTAVGHLREVMETTLVATWDADVLVDHRSRRPVMHLVEGVNTGLTWPAIELRHGRDPDGRDVLLLVGAEPDIRWRAFSADVVALAGLPVVGHAVLRDGHAAGGREVLDAVEPVAATDLEARRCREAEVVVVGGGNSAGQAAMYLATTARCVHLVYRGAVLGRSMSHYLVSRLEHAPNVRIHTGSEVQFLRGGDQLESVTVVNGRGLRETIATRAVFVMIGSDHHIRVINRKGTELLGFPKGVTPEGQRVQDVVRGQWERGEFGSTTNFAPLRRSSATAASMSSTARPMCSTPRNGGAGGLAGAYRPKTV